MKNDTHNQTKYLFKPKVNNLFRHNWFAFVFIILFHMGLIFIERSLALISIWLTTLLLLTPAGKQFISLEKPNQKYWYFVGPFLGFIMVCLSTFLCWLIMGWQQNNIFVDMAKTVGIGYHMLGENTAFSVRIIFLLFAWYIGPFLEEPLFRGYTQSFLNKYLGIWPAILLQALLFILIHPLTSLSWPITIFTAGALYGWIRIKSQSIWPAILAHAAYNTGILIISFAFLPHLIYK